MHSHMWLVYEGILVIWFNNYYIIFYATETLRKMLKGQSLLLKSLQIRQQNINNGVLPIM